MAWKDLFYFSKGERRGFIIVIGIIVAGCLWVWYSKIEPKTSALETTKTEKTETKENSPTPSTTAENLTQTPAATTAPDNKIVKTEEKREPVTDRVQRLTSNTRTSYPRSEKFSEGTVVELNSADTTTLKKIPGIGSAFARRIVSYRNLLGGYYSITQLGEVYGIDEEKYNEISSWFEIDASQIIKLNTNTAPFDSLNRHPYISYNQARVIAQLRKQQKLNGWENLKLLNEFTEADRIRLIHYLSFE